MKNTTTMRMCALAGLLMVGGTAAANAVPFSGMEPTAPFGSFTGNLTYTAASNTSATLTISLTNTSPLSNHGYITAFLLNNPSGKITGITSFIDQPSNGTFNRLGLTNNGLNGSPNGNFDFGASTGSSYLGSGSPLTGIAVGNTDSFTFGLTGTTLLSLNDSAFFNEFSVGKSGGQRDAAFVVRFRGFDDDKSDKVIGTPTPIVTPVPEPATVALLGIGLAATGLIRRRQTKP